MNQTNRIIDAFHKAANAIFAGEDASKYIEILKDYTEKTSPPNTDNWDDFNFDKFEKIFLIKGDLSEFDKRCYEAAAKLFSGGHHAMWVAQIYNMMGNKKQPSIEDIQKINDSLTKIRSVIACIAFSWIDSTEETIVQDRNLIYFERIETQARNSNIPDILVWVYVEPILSTFARNKGNFQDVCGDLMKCFIVKSHHPKTYKL